VRGDDERFNVTHHIIIFIGTINIVSNIGVLKENYIMNMRVVKCLLLIPFRNQWALFRPKTNVLWVCYLLKDLIKGQRSHKKLAGILKVIRECSSCVDMLKFF